MDVPWSRADSWTPKRFIFKTNQSPKGLVQAQAQGQAQAKAQGNGLGC